MQPPSIMPQCMGRLYCCWACFESYWKHHECLYYRWVSTTVCWKPLTWLFGVYIADEYRSQYVESHQHDCSVCIAQMSIDHSMLNKSNTTAVVEGRTAVAGWLDAVQPIIAWPGVQLVLGLVWELSVIIYIYIYIWLSVMKFPFVCLIFVYDLICWHVWMYACMYLAYRYFSLFEFCLWLAFLCACWYSAWWLLHVAINVFGSVSGLLFSSYFLSGILKYYWNSHNYWP